MAKKAIDVETAVQVALLNNKGLQAAYADLATLQLASETRRAWINAVAAWETVGQLNQAQAAADAASERREGGQCPLGSTLGLSGLPRQLRHRPALPQQRRAAAHQDRGAVAPHL
ncbi:hypothetical protein BWO76_02790 (plasmid) [Sinorhizobium meliloti]|nr:hypothetical protein BWO76_02790 [Sinorhizobium meliloti]